MTKKKELLSAGWNFDNSYGRLPKAFFSSQQPNPVRSPDLVVFNEELAEALGLNANALQSKEGTALLAGNQAPEGGLPIAQAYAGHQFGHFTMLGDGRALLLGEHITPAGKRIDIQLKGSGRTPYSRGGDGRAALGPMLREYIVSEAMHALGIPTTRSLAVVATGEKVNRETALPGAVLTRVAASHIRVGTFEYGARGTSEDDFRALADYTINRHYSHIANDENPYLSLFREVAKRQGALIAHWQLVGFIHGVMNTDNMALSGETIDYGPCAFMDTYDPGTVFSSIDAQGRYAYANQPIIGGWNLARFAETLLSFIHDDQKEAVRLAQDALSEYDQTFKQTWLKGMLAKLGLFREQENDKSLVEELLELMQKHRADYTNTFVALTFNRLTEAPLFKQTDFQNWHTRWQERLDQQPESREAAEKRMKENNPAIIPRNHRVEEALEAAVKNQDYSVMQNLLKALANPYAHSAEQVPYASLPEPTLRPYRTFCGT